jgi:hypothetical protein
MKRLRNDPEENVWHKYLLIVLKQTNAVPHTMTIHSNLPQRSLGSPSNEVLMN